MRRALATIAALVLAGAAQAATIQLIGGAGFSDSTIVSPEGGNTGTTLGQQRTILFQTAANVWGAALSSSQVIKVSAAFNALSCTATAGTLGSAGATSNIILNVGSKQRYFAVALAEALVDQNINGTDAEITANFNSRVDQNDTSCLGSTRFYYGLTGPAPAGTIALYPVVLHELAHGLGFAPLMCRTPGGCTNPTTAFGGYFNGIPDIWSEFARDNNTGGTGLNKHWVDMTTAERAASFTNDPGVVWNGLSVTSNIGGQLAVARNEGRLRLYAPGTYVQGSSVAHFHSDASPNLLMEPSLNTDVFTQTDLTDCLLQDVGWDDSRCALVLNNVPTLDAIASPAAINEDAGPQTVNLTGIGDGDPVVQAVSITAVSSNPGLIPNPTVNYLDPATTGTLTYTPVANQSGAAVITVTARDDGDSAYVPNAVQRTFSVIVNAVNDPPQATNLSANETYTEDTTLDLTDIVVSDVDSSIVYALLVLSPPAAGSLTTGAAGDTTSGYDPATGRWYAAGLTADVNTLLAGVKFVPALNSTASASIAVSVDDGTAPAATGTKLLTAIPVNDPPSVNFFDDVVRYTEDTPYNIFDYAIGDVDSTTLSVKLQLNPASLGSLSTATAGSTTSTYNAGTGVWQASGPISELQTLLFGEIFTPTLNSSADGTLVFTVSDGIAGDVTVTRPLVGTAVNDAPQVTNLTAPETYTEDTPLDLTDIVTSDVDDTQLRVFLVLSAPAAGSLTAGAWGSASATYEAGTGTWMGQGPIADLNGLLATVHFVPAQNYNANFSIYVEVGSVGGGSFVSGNKAMTGIGTNDPPQATNLFANQTYVEDTTLDLTDTVVSDPDGGNTTAVLSLAPANAGVLTTGTAGSTTSTYVAATGVWTASGPIAEVNALLAGVAFVPAANSSATVTLGISVSDGTATPLAGSRTLTGTPVNDAPVAGGAAAAQTDEDVAVAITLTASDIDSGTLQATLSVSNGVLTLPSAAGLAFTTGDGTADAAMSFSGPPATVNAALAGITYASAHDVNGADALQYTLSDGAAPTQQRTVAITIAPVADVRNDAITVAEDGAATFNVLTGSGGATADTFFPGGATLAGVGTPLHGSVIFSSGGSVTYTPAANYQGGDTFTYTASAAGSTETGQVTITVANINDPPTLDAITGPAPLPANADTQTVMLSGIGPGPGESQVLTVTAVSSNPTVIPNPTVSYASPGATGSISFAPVHNAIGTATITVTVTDDGGGTNSVARSFVVDVGADDVIFADGFD